MSQVGESSRDVAMVLAFFMRHPGWGRILFILRALSALEEETRMNSFACKTNFGKNQPGIDLVQKAGKQALRIRLVL